MNNVLKPCPFCGGELIRTEHIDIKTKARTGIYYWIHPCNNCILDPRSVHITILDYDEDIAEWNRRAGEEDNNEQ